MILGFAMAGQTVITVLTKLIATKDVPMINLIVVMDHVSMTSGNAMAGQTVMTVLTKLIVAIQHVKIKVYGIVAMASVSQHHMFVMAQLNFVTQVGDQTVPMARMKV